MRRMFTEKQVKNLAGKKIEEVVPEMIGQAIQDDKDILSQIEYDEENDILIFPKNVLPLRIVTADDTKFYFDYNEDALVDTYNEVVTGLDYDTNNRVNILSWIENVDAGNIVSIQYILFDVSNDLELKTYYIYHPITSGGTKLYRAEYNDSSNFIKYVFIVNKSTLDGNDLRVISGEIQGFASNSDKYIFLDASGYYTGGAVNGIQAHYIKVGQTTIQTFNKTKDNFTITEL